MFNSTKLILISCAITASLGICADETLRMSSQGKVLAAQNYASILTKLSKNLSANDALTWRYLDKQGVIILANEQGNNSPTSCVLFNAHTGTLEPVFGSDPLKSCRFTGNPEIMHKRNITWISIPVEIDATGEDREFLPGTISLIFERKKRRFCVPDANEGSKWACSKYISDQFYK